ncbi:hypothetical protein KY285_035448 [Solanum tuberosum]|nr:hypothetical protein KY285_035448 [Solanum tuberosum]
MRSSLVRELLVFIGVFGSSKSVVKLLLLVHPVPVHCPQQGKQLLASSLLLSDFDEC